MQKDRWKDGIFFDDEALFFESITNNILIHLSTKVCSNSTKGAFRFRQWPIYFLSLSTFSPTSATVQLSIMATWFVHDPYSFEGTFLFFARFSPPFSAHLSFLFFLFLSNFHLQDKQYLASPTINTEPTLMHTFIMLL